MKNKRVWGIMGLLLAVALLAVVVFPAAGQGGDSLESIQVLSDTATVRYPRAIEFELRVASDDARIDSVRLFWRAGFDDAFQVISLRPVGGPENSATINWRLNTPSFSLPNLPPFGQVTYRWQIRDESGNLLTTENTAVDFVDDTQDWQELDTDRVRVLYYDLENDFAESLLAIADAAYARLEAYFGVSPDDRPIVLIYPDQESFVEFQAIANVDSVIGRYFPGHNISANLVTADMEEAQYAATIAHELSHLFVDTFYVGFTRLPLWLDEGLAQFNEQMIDINEIERIKAAAESDLLLDFIDLPFAIRHPDVHIANLAYAQSATLYHFIQDQWGTGGIADFLNAFRSTSDFNRVTTDIFELTQAEFEIAWRAWLGFPVESVPELPPPLPTLDPMILPTAPPMMAPGG